MSLAQQAIAELESTHEFFTRSTRVLTDEHSAFTPQPGMRSVAQTVAHTAQTVDWFLEGAFRPDGFSEEWEAMEAAIQRCPSLTDARAWLDRSINQAKDVVGGKSDEELLVPLPPGPIMGGAPRMAVFSALTDHTAHHRGALTVYARLLGLVPPMPYMDME